VIFLGKKRKRGERKIGRGLVFFYFKEVSPSLLIGRRGKGECFLCWAQERGGQPKKGG